MLKILLGCVETLIIVSLAQGTHIFGFPVQRYSGLAGPIYTFVDICKSIFGGMITWSSFIISIISIPILYSGKMAQIKYVQKAGGPCIPAFKPFYVSNIYFRYKEKLNGFPIPTELVLVGVTTLIFYFWDVEIKVVGDVPGGLPAPRIPNPVDMTKVGFDAFAIAVVSYATTLSLGKIFSSKKGYSFR